MSMPLPPPDAPQSDFSLYARCLHGIEVVESLELVRAALINDLAKLYRLKAAGQPVQIPTEIIVKDVVVRLS